MLNCKIKLIKTPKLLFGHCWAVYCHIAMDKSNTYLIKKPNNHFSFHGDFKAQNFIKTATLKSDRLMTDSIFEPCWSRFLCFHSWINTNRDEVVQFVSGIFSMSSFL